MKRSPENEHLGFSDTPVLPGSRYTVPDGTRQPPPIVSLKSGNAVLSDVLILIE